MRAVKDTAIEAVKVFVVNCSTLLPKAGIITEKASLSWRHITSAFSDRIH